jgi:hypothetical protein
MSRDDDDFGDFSGPLSRFSELFETGTKDKDSGLVMIKGNFDNLEISCAEFNALFKGKHVKGCSFIETTFTAGTTTTIDAAKGTTNTTGKIDLGGSDMD